MDSFLTTLQNWLATAWVREIGVLLLTTLAAYLPARVLRDRLRARRAAGISEARDDRFVRSLIEAGIWPVTAMLLMTAVTEIALRWNQPWFVPNYRVMPILGFFLGYRLIGEAVHEALPDDHARRRVQRIVLPMFFIAVALQQLELLSPLIQWMRTEMFRLGEVGVSLFSIFSALLVVAGFSLGGRAVSSIIGHRVLPNVGLDHALSDAVGAIVRYLLLVVGFMVALETLGFDLSSLTIALGALGVGVGFGLQNIVNNFISGIILLFERSVKRGDILNAAGTDGRVQMIGIRSSVLRTRQGDDIIVPNSLLVSERVTNYSFGDRLKRLDVQIGVSYEADPRTVEKVLLAVAAENSRVLGHPDPTVLFLDFADSAIIFELRVWLADAWILPQVRSELLFGIWYALAEHGISIPYPQRDLHLKSGWPAAREAQSS